MQVNRQRTTKVLLGGIFIEDIRCAQDLRALTDVLEATPFAFALELAALAARREYLNLEKWLQERLTAHGVPFVQVSFLFVSAAPSSDDQARINMMIFSVGSVLTTS